MRKPSTRYFSLSAVNGGQEIHSILIVFVGITKKIVNTKFYTIALKFCLEWFLEGIEGAQLGKSSLMIWDKKVS